MARRSAIAVVVWAAFVAVLALPTVAWGQTPEIRNSARSGGWTLTLKGRITKVLPIRKVPATHSWDGTKAGNINSSLRYVYKGQLLYKLLGLVDDKKPGFNVAKAKRGYTIKLICLDGYKPTFSSKILFRKGKLRTDLIVAKKKIIAGVLQLLPASEAPFRFVGGPPVTQPFNNKLSAYMITKIRLIF